ncbi:RNA dependent RNA polymerase-domain-containing protein [Xylariaceae sp. FL1651]|nr:RNA dependent RNA polymerase-domain-containing protein [Xylariaceae sp. FL1651]
METALSPTRTAPAALWNLQHAGVRPDWRDWSELSIRISSLPAQTTTLDLWKHFQRFGKIVYIEIFESKRNATLRFSPPPSEPCWQERTEIKIQGQLCKVHVALQRRRDREEVLTPEGNKYYAQLSIEPAELQFGVLAQEDKFMAMRTIANTPRDDFSFLLDLKHRRLEIRFSCIIKDPRRIDPKIKHPSTVGDREETTTYMTRINFQHLTRLVFLDEGEFTFSVLIPLQTPPIFFKKNDYARSHSADKSSWGEWDTWNRTADIVYDTSWFKDDRVSIPKAHQFIDIGRWTTYKLVFTRSRANHFMWDTMRKVLKDFNISIQYTTAESFRTVPASEYKIWEILEPKTTVNTPYANLVLLAATEEVNLPYDVWYQLEVCISQGYLHEINLDNEFLHKLGELSKARSGRRNRAKDLLTYVAESGGLRKADESKLYPKRFYDPLALFSDRVALSHYPELGLPDHCTWVRKVVVTPSTMYLSTPVPEPSNRVLRYFSSHSDHFLRVQFTDELVKGRIFASPDSMQHNALYNRVFRTLLNGIQVGGRHFQFLAFGNSQFRENGAYFFSPTDHLSCDQIRDWMGDVKHIKVVAKYAARLGQCFSTTRALRDNPISKTIEVIEDISRNGWCFTDGVGKISPKLAEYIAKPLRQGEKLIPSAFQFRLGGSKGLLVVWPELPFNEVMLRPSQQKFKALSEKLEIIKSSRFSVATLNRQTITILSCLGIPDTVFLQLQKNQLTAYDRAMVEPKTAMSLLSRFIDQNGVTTTMAQMIVDGFMQAREPFFVCLLQVWRAWSLRLLREKARIVVEKGAFVFGCVDETCTLRGYYNSVELGTEGSSSGEELPQIFLQVPRLDAQPGDGNYYKVITGLCVVGRNPSLHPGDIRVVEAVDVPALRHIRDVVVFPATGDRDIPSMCSGGDLDGDDFFVIWDPDLIPPEQNHPPMIHQPVKPMELHRDVRPSDLITFFVNYMKNDSLSTIAHAHLAQSDQLEGGPKHPKCIELAQLHSNAVDYPKSGQPAHLARSMRPRSFPHFMEKPGRSYQSYNILGRLYDVVTKAEFRPNYSDAFDERIIRRFALSDDLLKKARIVKRQHDRALRQIMNQREISTEFEVWSTFVLTKPRVGSDYQMQDTMGPIIANHRERFRDVSIRVAGSRDPQVLYPFVAAAYRVTSEQVRIALRKPDMGVEAVTPDPSMPFISFPWIFEQELGRIANLEQEYQLESCPEVAADAVDEGYDENEYERLLGIGIFDPRLDDVEGEMTGIAEEVTHTLLEEETVVVEEETGMDELENLMGEDYA